VLLTAAIACRPKPAQIPPGADELWVEMDHEERVAHMSQTVVPRMRELFQGYDAEQFSEFGCETCHGSSARQGNYEMPSPELTVLDPRVYFRKHRRETPEWNDFMWEEVELEMAALLGRHRYVFKRQRGLRCRDCHTLKRE
jgi:hypothetical protein